MMNGLPWLNQNAWIASALLVIAFAGAGMTMAWHILETRSTRFGYLVVAGLFVMALSFVFVGMSVGEQPIVENRSLIPLIRILWLAGAVLLNSFMVMYWWARVDWHKIGLFRRLFVDNQVN